MSDDCYFSHDEGCEHLTSTTIDEAMEEYTQDADQKDWPKEITIYRFERIAISEADKNRMADHMLGNFVESLDEEHGDPNEDGTEITNEMSAAAREFVDKVIAQYTVWGCEVVGKETVNVADWAEKNLLDGTEEDQEILDAITRLRGTP